MKLSLTWSFALIAAICPILLTAQLPWLVNPIIEETDFFYIPDLSEELIFIGKKPEPQRLQRLDGSYLFDGQQFIRLQVNAANGVFTGMTLDKKPIVFTSDGLILSEGYDDLNNQYRGNILMTKKDNLFGLMDVTGKVIRQPIYKNLRRKEQGFYQGELPNGEVEEIRMEETDGLTAKERASALRIHSSQLKDRIMVRKQSGKRNYPYWGMTDMEGKEVLPANRYYSNYNKMHFERQVMIAIDSQNDKEGVLDKDGQVIIPFIYDYVMPRLVNDQYCLARRDDSTFLVDFSGHELYAVAGQGFSPIGGTTLVTQNRDNKYRLHTLDFVPVIKDEFNWISGAFNENRFLMLKRGKQTGFYTISSGRVVTPRFSKVKGPYSTSPLLVKEKAWGLYDVEKDEYVLPPEFSGLVRKGNYFLAESTLQDSIKNDDGTYRKTFTMSYRIYQLDGQLLFGPTENRLRSLTSNLWSEQVTRDSLVLHDFSTTATRSFSTKGRKIIGDVLQLGETQYVFADAYINSSSPPIYEFLGKDDVNHHLRHYKLNGKFGLMRNQEIITPPIYDEISLKFMDHGIKARVGNKWGVLTKPEGL